MIANTEMNDFLMNNPKSNQISMKGFWSSALKPSIGYCAMNQKIASKIEFKKFHNKNWKGQVSKNSSNKN